MTKRVIHQIEDTIWGRDIKNRSYKEQAAKTVAMRLKNGDIVGVGSGSTSYLTLLALVQRRDKKSLDFRVITTSIEMELICKALFVPTTLVHVEQPNWTFDGADEVDDKGNMIKGRGGALLREKILMQSSSEIYIAIDPSKLVKRLGEKFPIPVEINPQAIQIVEQALKQFSTLSSFSLRQAIAKDGPVITENGNLILDVKFSKITEDMESKLKSIVGVVETGLFIGYKPKIIMRS